MSTTATDGIPEQFQEFWGIVVNVWETSFLGIGVGQGLLAILVVLIGIGIRGLIAKWLLAAL